MSEAPPELPPEAFDREDDGDDLAFYAEPRLVRHIDDGAVAALTALYARLLPADGLILDLMSSWVSHLPADLPTGGVIGHGMNAEELAANKQLTTWFIQDLNADQTLPLESRSIDAALCCAGVQYLRHPIQVALEIRRVLRPGAPFLISFSNRCFATKAVDIWLKLSNHGHNNLVRHYLERAGYSDIESFVAADGSAGDPLIVVAGRA